MLSVLFLWMRRKYIPSVPLKVRFNSKYVYTYGWVSIFFLIFIVKQSAMKSTGTTHIHPYSLPPHTNCKTFPLIYLWLFFFGQIPTRQRYHFRMVRAFGFIHVSFPHLFQGGVWHVYILMIPIATQPSLKALLRQPCDQPNGRFGHQRSSSPCGRSSRRSASLGIPGAVLAQGGDPTGNEDFVCVFFLGFFFGFIKNIFPFCFMPRIAALRRPITMDSQTNSIVMSLLCGPNPSVNRSKSLSWLCSKVAVW